MKLNIIKPKKQKWSINDLTAGDMFFKADTLYLLTDESDEDDDALCVICIHSGSLSFMYRHEYVERIKTADIKFEMDVNYG